MEQIDCLGVADEGRAQRQLGYYLDQGFWRRDEGLREARQRCGTLAPAVVRIATSDLGDAQLRQIVYLPTQICERILIVAGHDQDALALSLLRSDRVGSFDDHDFTVVSYQAQFLLALIEKQVALESAVRPASTLVTSLDEICRRIVAAPTRLTRRELEVCSRVIYGMSAKGIAVDLDIGEESVTTYRKRAYDRRSIATHRELMIRTSI